MERVLKSALGKAVRIGELGNGFVTQLLEPRWLLVQEQTA